jgi:hypothetical protein
MRPPTNKKHSIKYTAQPPRKRRGFFHGCHFPAHTLFYLTKVNKIKYNKMAINSLQLHIINSRLRSFVHFSGNYLTFLGKKHPPGYLINLLTY